MKNNSIRIGKEHKDLLLLLVVSLCMSIVPTVHAANNALSFNGTSSYVTFGQAPGLGVTNFTIECWFRQESGGSTANTGVGGLDAIPLVTKGRGESEDADRNMNFFLGIDTSSRLAVDFEDTQGGGNHPFFHATAISLNTWYHAAATYDGVRWRLYLNGVEQVQSTPANSTARWDSLQHAALATALTSHLASPPIAPSGFFKGRIDEVRIWNYVRTATQISDNRFNEIATEAGLIARWSLNENSGTTVGDSTGRGNIGNFVNTPTWVTGAPLTSHAPNTLIVSPLDGSTGVALSPTLTANASDPDASSMTVTFYGRKAPEDFVIIALPDTQRYCDVNLTLQDRFPAQTSWIVEQRIPSNIVYVAHLGDCVEHGDTHDAEWQTAIGAMYQLEDPCTTLLKHGVPYGIAVGNHDMGTGGGSGATTKYNQYFGNSHFTPRAYPDGYYGGRYGTSNNDNHYDLFSAGGMDFIVIYFKWDSGTPGPTSDILTWANNLLQTHGNRRGIVVSHYIVEHGNPASLGPQGRAIYNALCKNPNFHLMLSGHVTREGRRIIGVNGSKVMGMLSDYQDDANGGDGYLRVLLFSPSRNKIYVKTYSPYTGQYRADNAPGSSTFELDYDMQDGYTSLGVNTGVASGSDTSRNWPNLLTDTKYQWYVTANDGTTVSRSAVNTFTTVPNIHVDALAPGPTHDGTSWQTAFLTIQEGINAAGNGYTVLVAPGGYPESIDFLGKSITVRGTGAQIYSEFMDFGPIVQFVSGEGSSAVLEGFMIAGGYPDGGSGYGGGLRIINSSPTIRNCSIQGNAAWLGGGAYIESGSPVFTHCNFVWNYSGAEGAGVYARGSGNNCRPKFYNCWFYGNQAGTDGGGLAMVYDSWAEIVNCTFNDNVAANSGGAIHNGFPSSQVDISNSILWNNNPQEIAGDANPNYSNIRGGWPYGTGNIDADPLFVAGSSALTSGSPCLDAGWNAFVSVFTDMNGQPRILDGNGDLLLVVDMGVDEYCP